MKIYKILGSIPNSKKAIAFVSVMLLALAFHCANWNKKKIIANDVIIYYEYLTAAFMFQDLTFEFARNLPEDFDGQIWTEKLDNGERTIKMTCGTAILISPFYLMASGINKITGGESYGYSPLFQFFVFLSSFFYCILGLCLQRKILKKFFSENTVALVLIILGIGTNLAFYTSGEAGMSHVYSFFLFSWFIWLTMRWHDSPNWVNSLKLGAVLGLITLVRPPNAIIALIPILYGIKEWKDITWKFRFVRSNLGLSTLAIVVFLCVTSIQLMLWKTVSGTWLSYGYGEEGFFWNNPKIWDVLFSFRKGFFLYAPILLLAVVGLFMRHEKTKKLGIGTRLYLLLNLYIISSWWCWWYGGGYGMRSMIESTAVLSLFLGIAVEFLLHKSRKLGKVSLAIICFLCLSLNIIQTIQYTKGILHYDGMNSLAYKKIFFKFKYPPNYSEYISRPNYKEAKKGIR